MFNRLALTAVFAVFSAAASTIPCATGVADVTTLNSTNGNTCNFDGITYGNFSVDSSGFSSVLIGIIGATQIGHEYTLQFSLATDPAVVTVSNGSYVRMYYQTTAPGAWIDSVDLTNVDGRGVIIYEDVCAVPFSGHSGNCDGSDLLKHLVAFPGDHVTASIPNVSTIYEMKYIGFSDASSTRFDQSVGAPEPGGLITALVGLALIMAAKIRR